MCLPQLEKQNKLNIQQHLDIDSIFNPELLALKIESNLIHGKIHLTSTGEGFCFNENGLYSALDNISSFCNIPKKNITIDSWNLKESHPEYNINIINEIYDCHYFSNPKQVEIPCDYKVAAFLGRGTFNRFLFHIHLNRIKRRNNLLYTFHQNLMTIPWPSGLKEILAQGYGDYVKLRDELPISDIGYNLQTPITPPLNIFGLEDAYKNVGLEIVIETVDKGFFITEKTLRPMFFGKPFIIIGAPNFESNLEKLGFEIDFNFDFDVKQTYGPQRIQFVIDIINKWYDAIDKYKWVESIIPKLEHNQQLLKKYALQKGNIDKSVVDSLL